MVFSKTNKQFNFIILTVACERDGEIMVRKLK